MILTPPVVRRVCVVRLGGMGDILLATPAVRALSEHFQTAHGEPPVIDFIVARKMQEALTGVPYLRRIVEFSSRGGDARPARFGRFLLDLRRERYDLFINFQPGVKTHLMALASGAPRVVTFHKDRRKQPDTGRVRHAVDDFAKELRPLGIRSVEDRRLDFMVPEAAHARVGELLRGEGVEDRDRLVVINPGATRPINRWSPDKFRALIIALARDSSPRLVLCGGPGDVDLAQSIVQGTNVFSLINLAGRTTVKELGALLARADVVVTADTGPMHIASAVGARLVVLSGAADPDRTGPLEVPGGPEQLVVINRALPCVSCQGRYCARGDIACMTELPVSWVVEAVWRQLNQALPTAPPAPNRPQGRAPGGARYGAAGKRLAPPITQPTAGYPGAGGG